VLAVVLASVSSPAFFSSALIAVVPLLVLVCSIAGVAVGSSLAMVRDRQPARLATPGVYAVDRVRRRPPLEVTVAVIFVAITLWRLPEIIDASSLGAGAAVILVTMALCYFGAISMALTLIDRATHRLPNAIVLPAYAVLAVILSGAAALSGEWVAGARAALSAGCLFAAYLTLALISPRGMGMGDVKLSGVIGLITGWIGWTAVVVATVIAFVLAALVALGLVATRRAGGATHIAFGPWMLAGAWIGIVWGQPLARGYLQLVGLS
jgi:leader peptidase (prepilin peptidase)/N-methyltransferase